MRLEEEKIALLVQKQQHMLLKSTSNNSHTVYHFAKEYAFAHLTCSNFIFQNTDWKLCRLHTLQNSYSISHLLGTATTL